MTSMSAAQIKPAIVRSDWDRRFRKRVDAFYRGEVMLTDQEAARYLAGEDPDLVTVTRYLDGDLGDEEAAAVEERFQTDTEFALEFLPLLEVQQRAHDPRYQDVLEHSTVRRTWKRQSRWGLFLLVAFVTLVVGAVIKVKVGGFLRNRAIVGQIATGVAPSSVIGGKVIAAAERDSVVGFRGVDLSLRPQTIYTAKLFKDGSGWAALDGEAAFHSWAASLNIFTATSLIKFSAGRYAIRSLPHSGETRIVVDSGWVEVRRLPDLQLMSKIDSGGRAVIRPGARVMITNERDGFPSAAFTPPVGTLQNDTSADMQRARKGARRLNKAINKVDQ